MKLTLAKAIVFFLKKKLYGSNGIHYLLWSLCNLGLFALKEEVRDLAYVNYVFLQQYSIISLCARYFFSYLNNK
jgi:hypothetical protein